MMACLVRSPFELQPVGAALAKLLASEREDRVAQEQQQHERGQSPSLAERVAC
jgi:hypothetical protein